MVNLEWYRSFIAVYQAGTVTAAARLIHLTQPAVSQHISSLEITLGIQLFERKPRKMIPTNEAKALYTQVISPIGLLESTTHAYHREKNQIQTLIRIGSPPEFFCKNVLKTLNTDTLRYRIEFDSAERLLEKLEAHDIDIAIATKKESYSKIIEYKKVFIEKFVLVQSSKFPSTLKQHADTSELMPSEELLLQQKWISYGTDLPIIRRFWRETFNSRPSIKASLVIPNLTLICKAVELGKGISILPYYVCEDSIKAGLINVVDSLETNVTNEIWAAYRKEDLSNENVSLIVNLLRNQLP